MDILAFVKQELKEDCSGHSFLHAERVAEWTEKLRQTEGGNARILYAASYLHDTIDSKLFKDVEAQKKKVNALLEENGYSKEERITILELISNLSWHLKKEPSTLEGQILADSDRLEALGAIGIIRCIEYGASKGRSFYEKKNLREENGQLIFGEVSETSLSHFYEKLLKLETGFYTPTARKIAHERTLFMKAFLKEFYQELAKEK